MCIMVMLKAKDTPTFQRHTVWVIITFTRAYSTRMYTYKYTLLNECNVITHEEYNLTAECLLLFVLFLVYYGVNCKKVLTNRQDIKYIRLG